MNNFLLSLTGFELDVETYYFDSFLELSKTRPPNSPKIKLKIEFWRLEINSGSISSMHTKIERDHRLKTLNGVKTP